MSASRQCILGLFAAIMLWAAAFALRADDQTQFGEQYSRNMISPEKSLPAAFDPKTGKNIKWKALSVPPPIRPRWWRAAGC